MGEIPRFQENHRNVPEVLGPEYDAAVNQVATEIRGDHDFIEVLDVPNGRIDELLARLLEGGAELDPVIKRSLRRAVRRALGLSDKSE